MVAGEEDGVVLRWEWVGLGDVEPVEVVDWDVSVVVVFGSGVTNWVLWFRIVMNTMVGCGVIV